MTNTTLDDVSDTALWVAVYRARESARPDALFSDPLAGRLAGERGATIERGMLDSRYVDWTVVIRTCIIDDYIARLVSEEKIDTIVNLGAGLDTRPYRLHLPASLRWIEVDFLKIISLKEAKLLSEKPVCRLERISLDLSNASERQTLFFRLNALSERILILTEGVTPYLDNVQVASLADALRAQPHFRFWITDYNSPELVKRLLRPSRRKRMKNAPFLFNPPDWNVFYEKTGWRQREMRYIGVEAERLSRPAPHPLWAKWMMKLLLPAAQKEKFNKMNGYAVLEAADRL